MRDEMKDRFSNSFDHANCLLKLFSYSYPQGNSGRNKFSDGSFCPSYLYVYIYIYI